MVDLRQRQRRPGGAADGGRAVAHAVNQHHVLRIGCAAQEQRRVGARTAITRKFDAAFLLQQFIQVLVARSGDFVRCDDDVVGQYVARQLRRTVRGDLHRRQRRFGAGQLRRRSWRESGKGADAGGKQ